MVRNKTGGIARIIVVPNVMFEYAPVPNKRRTKKISKRKALDLQWVRRVCAMILK